MQAKVVNIIIAWLIIAIIAMAISAYEIGGAEPNIPWNTISFLSKHHFWLALFVGALVAVAAMGFEVWWFVFHLPSNIEK